MVAWAACQKLQKLSEIITHPAVFSDTTCVRHILQQFGSVRWWPRKRTKRLKVDPVRGKKSQNKCHYFVSMSYMTSSPVFCFRLAKKPRGHKNWAKIAQKGWLRILFLKGTIICLWHSAFKQWAQIKMDRSKRELCFVWRETAWVSSPVYTSLRICIVKKSFNFACGCQCFKRRNHMYCKLYICH